MEIKKCPICGRMPEIETPVKCSYMASGFYSQWHIGCVDEDESGFPHTGPYPHHYLNVWDTTKEGVILEWNKMA